MFRKQKSGEKWIMSASKIKVSKMFGQDAVWESEMKALFSNSAANWHIDDMSHQSEEVCVIPTQKPIFSRLMSHQIYQ